MSSSNTIYSEQFYPWFLPLIFFLPWFWKYGIRVDKESITFGYGVLTGPSKGGLCSHTTYFRDVDKSSISTGYASGKDNLFQFGGWGIRHNIRNKTWAYNATFRGPYVEFSERHGEKLTKYRVVTGNADLVASLLARTNSQIMQGETKKNN